MDAFVTEHDVLMRKRDAVDEADSEGKAAADKVIDEHRQSAAKRARR